MNEPSGPNGPEVNAVAGRRVEGRAARERARPHSYTKLTGAPGCLPTPSGSTDGRDVRENPAGRQGGLDRATVGPYRGRGGGPEKSREGLDEDESRSVERDSRWARLDSNQGPTDYESAALTAELRAPRPRSPAARRAAPSPRRRYQRVRGFDWGGAQPECGPEWRAAPFQEPGWAGTGLREPHMSGRTEDDWGSVADQGDLGTGGSATRRTEDVRAVMP